MANQVSLMTYLQHGPPAFTVAYHGQQSTQNTRNIAYNANNINNVGHWASFNLHALLQQFGQILQTTRIVDDPFPTTPPRPIGDEPLLQLRINAYLYDRTKRALRSGFQNLAENHRMTGRAAVEMDGGTSAGLIRGFQPDLGFMEAALPVKHRPNRLPGDVKLSYKWAAHFQNLPGHPEFEFRQALSQVNYYMRQNNARYGFILTDRELVPIRRLDSNGNLELATPIPWAARGTAQQPQMTVLLGLWFLGMIASSNQGWQLPGNLS